MPGLVSCGIAVPVRVAARAGNFLLICLLRPHHYLDAVFAAVVLLDGEDHGLDIAVVLKVFVVAD